MQKTMSEEVTYRGAELLGDESKDMDAAIAALDQDFVRECFSANERGDGMLLAALLYNKFLYVTTPDKTGEWYQWQGNVWQADEFDNCFNMVEHAAVTYEDYAFDLEEQAKEKPEADQEKLQIIIAKYRDRAWKLRGKNKIATTLFMAPRVDSRIATIAENLDQNKWLLPCLNGVLDLKRGVLVEGRPSDLMTKRIGVKYNKDADYTLWQETINAICIDPNIDGSEELPGFLKRLFGYAITGNVNEEFLAIFLGPGRNGKGTILETISKVMGPYYHKANRSLFTEQKFEPPPSATSEHMFALHGKRLVIGAETNKGQRIDLGRIKDLTGGNEINYRRNYGSEKTYSATHTLLLETNNLAYGLTKEFSMLQRLVLIKFSYGFVDDIEAEEKKTPNLKGQFKQKNKNLKEQLKTNENMEGVLKWLLEGALEWQENGLQIPDCVIRERNALSEDEDYIQKFVHEIMEHQPDRENLRMKFSDFYKAFSWWWKENMDDGQGKKITHKNTVSKWLSDRKLKTEKIGGIKWVFHFEVKRDVQETVSELAGL